MFQQGHIIRHFQYLLCGIVPRSVLSANVMQATTCFQDGIANTLRQEADLVFDQPVSFPPTAGLFDTDADGSDRPIGRLLQWGAFTPTRCLLRLDDRDPRARQTLEPRLLIAITPDGEGRACQVREACLRRLALRGVAPEAPVTGLIEHQEGVNRVARVLATVGRWMGRSGPSCQHGGAWARPASMGPRATRRSRRPSGLGAALEALRPDSAPHGGDVSTDGRAIGTSHRVVLGLLGGDAVSRRSA